MRKLLLLAALFVATLGVSQPTSLLVGDLVTSSGQPLSNATLTLTLSQPAYITGLFTVASSPINCYTGSTGAFQGGTILGLPDPSATLTRTPNYASGTLPAATYYIKYAYYYNAQTTWVSPEMSTVMSSQGTLTISAPTLHPSGATGWRVYVGTSSGAETLQSSIPGWSSYVISAPLSSSTAPPTSNNTQCIFWFNDSMVPAYTTYSVLIQDVHGAQVRGWPQNYYFAGSRADLNSMTPAGNISAKFPTAIIASPSSGATQSINGGLTVTGVATAPDVKLGYQTAPPTTINSNAGWLYTQLSGAHTPLESTIFYQDGTGNAIDLLSTVASFSWPVGTAAGTGNYVGNGNGTTTYFLGTMPGTGGSGNPVGFVTDGVERARVTAGGAWCFNCTVPGTPVQISDTSAGVPLRIVGPNPGGVGVAMQFYEGATSAGQITAANGGGFSFASPASTPINFYNSPTLMFQLYQSGADSVGAFQGAGEWVGVVTGAVGLPASNKGRLIYDKTLQHFYASENGGAYTQLCLAGGSCGSGGGTSWLASSTVGGTNANTGTTYIGGNNTAAAAMAFVTNGVDRGRITGAGLWGINTTTPGRVLESSDTSGGIPLRLTGIATGGAGVAVEFYETSTSAGLITVAKNNVFAIAGVGATPVTLNSNSNLIFKAYNSGGDSIGQFLGGAEWFGVVTGAVGVSPANKGRLIYDSTLQHFYFSENGGAYAQLAGGGGSGWPIGTAAGSGVYNNPGAGPYFLGLLNTGTLGFSTNSAEAMRITASQQVLIGSTSVGSQAAPFLVSTSGVPIAEFNTTGANGQIFFESSSGTVRGYLTASNAGLTLASFGGAVPLIMMTNSTEAARFDVSQRLILGSTTGLTTGGVHRETIKSSDYGQLGLLQSAGGTSRLTLASTIAAVDTAGGELAFDTNNFLINTAGSAGASLILGTGASRTPMVTLTTGQVATFNVAGGSSFVIDSTGHPLITMKASGSLVGTVGDRGTSGNMSLHNSTSGANVTAYASAAQVDIIHGSSTTSFVANNGVVFPSCSFGSFPTGAIGTCVCTNCKNSSQDGTVSGATCQSGSHNALAFYNGNSTVCN